MIGEHLDAIKWTSDAKVSQNSNKIKKILRNHVDARMKERTRRMINDLSYISDLIHIIFTKASIYLSNSS